MTKTENQSMLQDLQGLFEDWRKEHRSRNFSSLARKTGSKYHEVVRIFQGETKASIEKISPLLAEIADFESAAAFYAKHFPKTADHLKLVSSKMVNAHHSAGKSQKADIISHEFRELLQDSNSYHVLALVACHSETGVSLEKIKELLGSFGHSAAIELINSGILEKNATGMIELSSNKVTIDAKVLMTMIQSSTKLLVRTDDNVMAYAFYNLVDEQTLTASREVMMEARDKVVALINANAGKGDIPITWAALLGRLDGQY